MDVLSRPLIDRTLPLLAEGYAWLPNRMRDAAGSVVRTRIMGRPALALRGPDAVRFFYDERNVHRHRAIPEPVLGTLFGHGAVHTLDGAAHRVRKELFLPLLDPAAVSGLTDHVVAAWDEAVPEWSARDSVVLFDEAATVLTRGVHRWAGIPLDDRDAAATARDMTAMVDGFATAGPRHLRARRARSRQEERLARLVRDVRSGQVTAPAGSVLERVCGHRDADGEPLDEKTAAVELLNVVRPTTALAWFVAFAAHALHRWPGNRAPLADGDVAFATAFAHEVRRFYPFVPFLGGLAARDLFWRGAWVPAGDWWCSTCTGRTTTRRCGATRTPSARGASSNGPWRATNSCRRAGATRRQATAAPERASPSACWRRSRRNSPVWSTRFRSRIWPSRCTVSRPSRTAVSSLRELAGPPVSGPPRAAPVVPLHVEEETKVSMRKVA